MKQDNQGPPQRCPNGHNNPAGQAYCGLCGAPLSGPQGGSSGRSWRIPAVGQAWISRRELVIPSLIILALVYLVGGAFVLQDVAGRLNVASSSGLSLRPQQHTIVGRVTVVDFSNVGRIDTPDRVAALQAQVAALEALKAGQTLPCPDGVGGGFDDIRAGTQVTIDDENGKVVGTSGLTGGIMDSEGCHFDFVIPSVPKADFYKIAVSHRGALTFSYSEMQQRNWNVEAKLD